MQPRGRCGASTAGTTAGGANDVMVVPSVARHVCACRVELTMHARCESIAAQHFNHRAHRGRAAADASERAQASADMSAAQLVFS